MLCRLRNGDEAAGSDVSDARILRVAEARKERMFDLLRVSIGVTAM